MSSRLARTTVVLLATVSISLSLPAVARDPGGIANNGFDNNGETGVPGSAYDAGKKERESKAYKKKTKAEFRDYYEKGGKSTNNDSKCRARLAYKAATYIGPKNGYDQNGKPNEGGGDYGKFPKDPRRIIHNIYKFVEDLLYPRKGSDGIDYKDKDICDAHERDPPSLDIGKPLTDEKYGFACIVAAHLFTSLVRELGFPAREKNIVYSNADGIFSYQTAAANVWYGGRWHFYDPWESFEFDYRKYLTDKGHASVAPGKYHDAYLWVRDTPPHMGGVGSSDYHFLLGVPQIDESGWGTGPKKKMKLDGTKVVFKSQALRIGVKQGERWLGGTLPDGNMVVGNQGVIYVRFDDPIPRSRLDPPGPETYNFELITLLHDEASPITDFGYTIVLSNNSDVTHDYALQIEAMPATREINVAFEPGTDRGQLAAGTSIEIPLVVNLGDTLDLPPEPVTDVSGRARGEVIELSWGAVAGASGYRIYRSQKFQEVFDETLSELIAEIEDTKIELKVGADDFIIVRATNETGLVSELDFEAGSVFVRDPDYVIESENGIGVSLVILFLCVGALVLVLILYRRAILS